MVSAGTPVTLVPGITISETFGPEGRISGTDGCNQHSGTYMVTGSQIQVGPNLASTMMACEPQVMDQASTYTRILVSPASWQVSGGRLTIQAGQSILVYVKQVPTVPTTAAPTAPPVLSPVGSWDVTSMTYMSGGSSVTKSPPDAQIYAIFGSDGTVQGFGGCNQYSAGYTTNGSSMTVGDIISTLMSCGNVYDTQERAYLGILGAAARFENTGTQLTIFDAGTPGSKIVFKPGTETPVPIPSAIMGTWSLTGMTKNNAALTLASGVTTTAVFGSDGKLSGNGGCNQYSGTYVLTGSSAIGVSPLATTRMMCPDPAMSQETSYLGILQNAAKWEYNSASGKLTITDSTSMKNTLVYTKS
ncbi:MAG: META domain-containing protein [Methanomicrobiales archaeon]|nr:META domain-containing protein [Methanomicrobiales archaeon]